MVAWSEGAAVVVVVVGGLPLELSLERGAPVLIAPRLGVKTLPPYGDGGGLDGADLVVLLA